MATGGDDEAQLESLVAATVGDTMAGGHVIVGDVAVVTEGADSQTNRLLDRLKHMKSS